MFQLTTMMGSYYPQPLPEVEQLIQDALNEGNLTIARLWTEFHRRVVSNLFPQPQELRPTAPLNVSETTVGTHPTVDYTVPNMLNNISEVSQNILEQPREEQATIAEVLRSPSAMAESPSSEPGNNLEGTPNIPQMPPIYVPMISEDAGNNSQEHLQQSEEVPTVAPEPLVETPRSAWSEVDRPREDLASSQASTVSEAVVEIENDVEILARFPQEEIREENIRQVRDAPQEIQEEVQEVVYNYRGPNFPVPRLVERRPPSPSRPQMSLRAEREFARSLATEIQNPLVKSTTSHQGVFAQVPERFKVFGAGTYFFTDQGLAFVDSGFQLWYIHPTNPSNPRPPYIKIRSAREINLEVQLARARDQSQAQGRRGQRKRQRLTEYTRAQLRGANPLRELQHVPRNSEEMADKEVLFARRAYIALKKLKNDLMRCPLNELLEKAARKNWGRIPPFLYTGNMRGYFLSVEAFAVLWPQPMRKAAGKWMHRYLEEFPEVFAVPGDEVMTSPILTPFARTVRCFPPPDLRALAVDKPPQVPLVPEFPFTDNPAVDWATLIRFYELMEFPLPSPDQSAASE